MATRKPKTPTTRKAAVAAAAQVANTIAPAPVPPVWHQSSTVRIVAGAALLSLLWTIAKAYGESPWPLVRPWLQGEDGLLIKSMGYKLAFGLMALALWWQNSRSRYRSNALNFRRDVWPLIVQGNVAVALYTGAALMASAVLLGMVL